MEGWYYEKKIFCVEYQGTTIRRGAKFMSAAEVFGIAETPRFEAALIDDDSVMSVLPIFFLPDFEEKATTA